MKKFKAIIITLLSSVLLLSACEEEGGFSFANDSFEPDSGEKQGDEIENPKDSQGDSNGSGGDTENGKDPQIVEGDGEQGEDPSGHQGGINVQDPEIKDTGINITIFKASFIQVDESFYANIKFDGDPFSETYDFAYYTVNEKTLAKPSFNEKETIESKETYKVFLGSNEAGTYIIKFFNTDDKQYGTSEVKIKRPSEMISRSYLAVAFNLIRVRIYSIGHTIQMHFQKIGDAIRRLFDSDYIRM